jgi:hypothetical protein
MNCAKLRVPQPSVLDTRFSGILPCVIGYLFPDFPKQSTGLLLKGKNVKEKENTMLFRKVGNQLHIYVVSNTRRDDTL